MTTLTHLECTRCRKRHETGRPQNLCACGGPLAARYDLAMARESWNRDWINNGPSSMWRYAPVLPVSKPTAMISLGEGMTPLVRASRLGAKLGAEQLWVKDESVNPTASYHARGIACAISMAVELGIRTVAIPSTGNAASALAAYAAAAGLEARIFLPSGVPQANFIECNAYGAQVTLVEGLLSDCAAIAAERSRLEGWLDLSALNEPYRIEGQKTLGYELAEQLRWQLPEVVVHPAGAGAGLIGIWKAFAELEELGWVVGGRPKLVAVQMEGCQPVVRAWERGEERCEFWENAWTMAGGLRVPDPPGGSLVLRAIRESGGMAVAVSDQAALDAGIELAAEEGLFPAPEGGACVAALRKLLAEGYLKPSERTVICNTASGLKYLEAYSTRFPLHAETEQDKLGGLITPR